MPDFSIDNLVQRMGRRRAFLQVFADVKFVHSWRVELAPRSYESGGRWYLDATDYADTVLQATREAPADSLFEARERTTRVSEEGMVYYQENQQAFRDFIEKIGVSSALAAGQRLEQSMWDFLLLSATVDGLDMPAARKKSYFFPFC